MLIWKLCALNCVSRQHKHACNHVKNASKSRRRRNERDTHTRVPTWCTLHQGQLAPNTAQQLCELLEMKTTCMHLAQVSQQRVLAAVGSENCPVHFYACCFLTIRRVSQFVGALSPVNHKGLHQGWTPTSLSLHVYSFHMSLYHNSCFLLLLLFWAYLYSAGTQHWKVHPTGWPILFCGPTQEPVSATTNTGKIRKRFWKKMQVNGPEG